MVSRRPHRFTFDLAQTTIQTRKLKPLVQKTYIRVTDGLSTWWPSFSRQQKLTILSSRTTRRNWDKSSAKQAYIDWNSQLWMRTRMRTLRWFSCHCVNIMLWQLQHLVFGVCIRFYHSVFLQSHTNYSFQVLIWINTNQMAEWPLFLRNGRWGMLDQKFPGDKFGK